MTYYFNKSVIINLSESFLIKSKMKLVFVFAITIATKSNVLVLPVLGVVDDALPLNIGVEPVVGRHARRGQVGRELSVETVEGGSLRGDLASLSTNGLGASLVNNVGVGLDDVCNRQ